MGEDGGGEGEDDDDGEEGDAEDDEHGQAQLEVRGLVFLADLPRLVHELRPDHDDEGRGGQEGHPT